MPIAATVIGAGSVGLGLAASLAVAGQCVTLLARSGAVGALRDAAITVSGLHGEHALPAGSIAIEDAARPSATARGCDMLVVTTKAYDIAAALAPFAGATPAPGAALSLHNGIGASEAIRAALGPAIPVYASAMMIGLERLGTRACREQGGGQPDQHRPAARRCGRAAGGLRRRGAGGLPADPRGPGHARHDPVQAAVQHLHEPDRRADRPDLWRAGDPSRHARPDRAPGRGDARGARRRPRSTASTAPLPGSAGTTASPRPPMTR